MPPQALLQESHMEDGERIATLEAHVDNIKNDLEEIKATLQEVRDAVKGRSAWINGAKWVFLLIGASVLQATHWIVDLFSR